MSQPPYGPPPGGTTPFPPPPQGQIPYPPPGSPQGMAPTTPPAKPFYKKPWFIGLTAVVAIGAIGSAVKDDTPTTTSAASAPTVPSTVAPTTQAVQPPATTPAPVATAAPTTVAAPAATTAPSVPVVDFAMPDLVGIDLQTAQNTVQAEGVFFSVSHDLLGSRHQAVDSNWIVCTQNVAPGRRVTGDVEGQIDFGVVKRTESCP